jgi:hypothetical protein
MPKYQTPSGIINYTFDVRFACMLLPGINRVEKAYGIYSPGGSPRYHYGIDIDTPDKDWRVRSTVSGKVVMSTIVPEGSTDKTWEWGNFICVLDDTETRHYFCHLNSRAVVVGQTVNAGDVIGVMGQTGNAKYDGQGKHVHYEVRKSPYRSKTDAIDPAPWAGIPNKQGQTVPETEEKEMGIMQVFGAAKGINTQAFESPSVNATPVNNVADGYYIVAEKVSGEAPYNWYGIYIGQALRYMPEGGAVADRCRYLSPAEAAKALGSPLNTNNDTAALEARLKVAESKIVSVRKIVVE